MSTIVVFAHLQCGLEPNNRDDPNSGSRWCHQRACRFGQRELSLPYAWKSLLSVTCLVFPFLLWPTLLTCSGRASVNATSLSFIEVFGLPTLFSLKYLANWYQESSQVQWCACHAWFGSVRWTLSSFSLFFFLLLFHMMHGIHPSSSQFDTPGWGFLGPLGLLEMSIIGSAWSMCDPVVFAHLQCGLEPRNLYGNNLDSCWYLQRARHFGQRELTLPYACKSLLSVACLVFPFSLLRPTLLTCSGRTSVIATAGWSRVPLSAGPCQDLANWYCSLVTRRTVCGRAAGNSPRKHKNERNETRNCTNSVVVLQDHCSYKAPRTTPPYHKKSCPSGWT